MNFAEMITTATRNLAFYLEHFADCEENGDVWGQRNARLGITRCLHVIRYAKAAGGIA